MSEATEIQKSTLNDALREDSIQEVLKDQAIRGKKYNKIDFIKEVGKKFIEKQIDAFPMICDITRFQNKLKQDELRHTGVRGKFTDSYGWSESMEFKHEFEIPEELYLFMVNLVYKDFWSNENVGVWRTFMKKILRGDDATETLMWAKMIYGSNSQKESVVSV